MEGNGKVNREEGDGNGKKEVKAVRENGKMEMVKNGKVEVAPLPRR